MSDMKTLLLELHCEEIPARFLKPLTQDFSTAFTKWAEGEKLGYEGITPYYSPRKLSWNISDLPVAQADQTELQVGPPQRMCVDEGGKPTVQGQKFAEKWGVGFETVRFEQPAGKKEPCAVVELTRKGRPTLDLLVEALPRLIAGLHVPKAMRWGNSSFEFVRPVRNVLCLFGKDVVPIEIDGVKATASTWGHRLYHMEHPKPIKVERPKEYVEALKAAGVVVSFSERRRILEGQLNELAAQTGGQVVKDEELLDTLAEIVECPRALRGEFPPEFMELPKEVLVTSLKEHQKSFCIEKTDGTDLLPFFLTVANRDDDPAGFIKAGNEWVLKARLYDARFFFAEDRRTPLQDRLEKLKQLTFHRELGSYLEKTERIQAIATGLAHALRLDFAQADHAARLSKADLMTLMVGEFPELQGVMGGEYLKHEGEPEAVWKAVKEHYHPVSAEDAIPSTPMGGLLAVADKLDTVAGCFAIGQIPSGSKDPLALRRAGIGITRILWEQGWTLSVEALVDLGLKAVANRASKPLPETREALLGFFKDRVAYQLEVAGYAGAVRRSALAIGWSDLVDLKARCEALSAFAEDERFASLAQSAKRIGNILKDEAPADAFEASVLQVTEEKALAEHLGRIEAASDQATLLAALAELAQPLAAFFDAVMVKCEDAALRGARLSLLHRLRKAFMRVADFSLWQ
ncbi:glycine--tRNA ligase subunit beta [Holophaga foetida]|uniref:glycine--tRNA ligase subunit beta n=1 Tax=Holophaga foetida TaxID=35839 RepID=UPI0002475323|nr:glycine--tRNA ligase subunit beta [Holophaga foetida]